MTTHIEQPVTAAAKSQAPTRGTRVKPTRAALILETKLKPVMRSVDEAIDGLADEQRDPFLHELIKTLEAMQ